MRLDKWLAETEAELSRSRIQKLIELGMVTVDGRARPASYRVADGQEVQWTQPVPVPTKMEPDPSVPFDIVYEDTTLAVIDKPAGVVVHPAAGHARGTLVQGLMARLDSLSGLGGEGRPGLVHRLDKDTSGLLVIAKTDFAHQNLQEQLQKRSLQRIYRALIWGHLREEVGEIDAPLDRDPRDRKKRAVVEGGRPARTRFRLLKVLNGASELEITLDTGRTHQIRVHMAYRGHPVLADPMYGGGERCLKGAAPEFRLALKKALSQLGRQALHAHRLEFFHPHHGEVLRFTSPLPPEMVKAIEGLQPESWGDDERGG